MKRYMVKITGAFLIMVIAMSVTIPLHAAASPGMVTIGGQVLFQGRNWNPPNNNWQYGKEMKIDLYEKDINGNDHYLVTTNTDGTGNFVFPSRENWWYPDSRQLNIFFEIVTVYPYTYVTDTLGGQYAFASYTTFLNHDGQWNLQFAVTNGWQDYQALWIFEDLRNAWDFVYNNFSLYNPGNVTAIWQNNLDCYLTICNSYTGYSGFIFIKNSQNNQMNVVAHETGHMFMINANGWWYWYPDCWSHYMFVTSSINCAWSEGWADFFSMAVNNTQCYNFNPYSCQGIPDTDYYNLEVHSRADTTSFPWGDNVEGRVAGALYDLYDYTNEGFDKISAGFSPIAYITLSNSQTQTFLDFWNNWISSSGQDQFLSGLTLWWNTINYENIQQMYLPTVMNTP
jgi:hypothetical protein